MALRSSLFASLSTRGIAASAAAVLMVGGGVAVAQSGAPSDTEVTETADGEATEQDGSEADGPEGPACPEAATFGLDTANGAGIEGEPDVCEDEPETEQSQEQEESDIQELNDGTEEDEVVDLEEEDDDVVANEDDEGDAQAFSEWVSTLPDDLGCLKGQLVSHYARQGPTSFEEGDLPTIGDSGEALEALTPEGGDYQPPGRCAERLFDDADGSSEGDDENGDEVESSSADAGPPDHAGTPGPPDHAKERAANATSNRPSHAGPPSGSDGPGNSGDAPGRGGNGDS